MKVLLKRKNVLIVSVVCGAVAAGAVAASSYWKSRTEADGTAGAVKPLPAESTAAPASGGNAQPAGNQVVLTDGQLAAARISAVPVERGSLTHAHTVPGRVRYNDNRHVAVRTPAAGIVTEVLVKPGDRVEAGQILARLNSPEVGTARADVLKWQAEYELASNLLERADRLEQHVTSLTAELREGDDFETVREKFADRELRDWRSKLFGAYSRFLLAESVIRSTRSLESSGILSGKTILERTGEQQSAEASLLAACEQAEIEVWQERSRAEVSAGDARRRLEIARQHLASLLMQRKVMDPTGGDPMPADEMGADDTHLELLSQVAIVAPFSGTIEERTFSATERVQPADPLFVLADTSSLWIEASIREQDWPAVEISAGEPVRVTVPALGGTELLANVYFVGRQVAEDTSAVPLMAEVDNAEGSLRPGLFVRVTLPVDTQSSVLSVPSSAVVQHDGQSFVFVQEGEKQFRRVDVAPGRTSGERIEILSGLEAGQQVVSTGAFILKSRLLLEQEGE